MLAGLIGFFVLEKIALLRYSYHHEGDGHHHHKGLRPARGRPRRRAHPGGQFAAQLGRRRGGGRLHRPMLGVL